MSFLVIDTEGKQDLKEVAVVDSTGQLVYHGFNRDYHPDHPHPQTLRQIVHQLRQLIDGQRLIFHYAEHDLAVLKSAFRKARQAWPEVEVTCTLQLAQKRLPNLDSYSLEYLSKHLGLTLGDRYFHPGMAHDASYDAAYTHELYQTLQQQLFPTLKDHPNPFANNRVDNPFQIHADNIEVYQGEFELLKSVLQDIHQDPNHQSRGVVLTGEPGAGKTHLIMRMAQQLLDRYRLLFIRQPNHPESVLHHTYSRMLESLVESVDGEHTQFDYLVANSIVYILKERSWERVPAELREALQSNPLAIYDRLGQPGSDRYRKEWHKVESHVLRWWIERYSIAGFGPDILRGIIKFCSYQKRDYREIIKRWLAGYELESEDTEKIGLPNWSESLSREAFALEAMTLIGKLSRVDEPLIVVFDQLEALGYSHYHDLLVKFGESIKELFTHVPNSLFIVNLFPERWQQFQSTFDGSIIDRISQYQIHLSTLSTQQLKSILNTRLEELDIDVDTLFSQDDLDDILHQSSIRKVLNRAAEYWRYRIQGIPLPPSLTSVAVPEIDIHDKVKQLEGSIIHLKQVVESILIAVPTIKIQKSTPQSVIAPTVYNTVTAYLQTSRETLTKEYEKVPIISDEDDIGKLRRVANALESLYPVELGILWLGKRVLPEHLVFKSAKKVIGFIHQTKVSHQRMRNFNELVITHPHLSFGLFRDARLPQLQSPAIRAELDRFMTAPNAKFLILTQDDRVFLELVNKLILDIQNKDLEVDLGEGLLILLEVERNWILTLILGQDYLKDDQLDRARARAKVK